MKKQYLICAVICIVLCMICIGVIIASVFYVPPSEKTPNEDYIDLEIEKPINTEIDIQNTEEYVSPIDFDKLKAQNPDIYGWIEIPGTKVDYPLLQHKRDDSYYLRYNVNGVRTSSGAIYTEATYNSTDFNDKVTTIYGHRTVSDEMFGSLEAMYSSPNNIADHKEIIIYLPDRELHYQVFAATRYGTEHIMYTYNKFSYDTALEEFLFSVYNTGEQAANYDKDITITNDDKLIVLSTCLRYDRTKRYLVLAKLM